MELLAPAEGPAPPQLLLAVLTLFTAAPGSNGAAALMTSRLRVRADII